jgi:hypothetical protein
MHKVTSSFTSQLALRKRLRHCQGRVGLHSCYSQEDKRGLKLTNKPRIMELVDKLAELQEGSPALTDPQLLSATWKLAWTTEKETLWIVQNAKLFGTQGAGISLAVAAVQCTSCLAAAWFFFNTHGQKCIPRGIQPRP